MSIERAEKVLTLQLEWVKTADSKVPPLFAIDIAMLGLLAALVKVLPSWTIPAAIACSIATIPLLLSLFSLALAMFPRLDGPKESKVFFGGITKQSEKNFKENFFSDDGSDYRDDILSQAYRNAEIASKKYSNIKFAFIFTFSSAIPWVIAVYLLYV
ncbi:MAG: hypothetical protein K1564_19360 [Candidatus Thiodiazotropha sp. (ex. Lucinisca nassula)]|nr:hypothetical protein [Candidatus Thiodiazotropha sp. (ex. Lucinisca nassula)]